ncbi:MAG: ankyrin repeat domain-containing protein [Armatimonadota bacterium]
MQCPQCGAPLEDATKRCPSCGQHPDGGPTPGRWPLWLIGAIAVCLVVAGLIGAGVMVSKREKQDGPPVVTVPIHNSSDQPPDKEPGSTAPKPDPGTPSQNTPPSTQTAGPQPKINDTAKQMLPDPEDEIKGLVKEMDIFGAIRDRDQARLATILQKHPELVDKRNYKGAAPLHLAAALEDEKMVRRLLEYKADVNAKCDQEMLAGQTALHIAAGRNAAAVMRILLKKGARVNTRDSMGATPLHEAASHGSLEAAALLLESGAAIEAKQSDGQTPLFWAAVVGGNVKVTRLLLDNDAEVNARDYSELTPLGWVVNMDNRTEIAALLKKYGGKE